MKPTIKSEEPRERIIAKGAALVEVERIMLSKLEGEFGLPAYRIVGSEGNFGIGVPVQKIAGVELHEGALIRVTVEVLKRGRRRRNPWSKKGKQKG